MKSGYKPTPIEEAYGAYLLESVFHFPPPSINDNGNDNNAVSSLRISGRQAVPFWVRSRIDRSVLRDVWSTVDPQNRGYLDEPGQFYASLRLIALAQAGVLQAYLPPCNTEQTEPPSPPGSAVAAMEACLRDTQHLSTVPLPAFEGIAVPDAAALMELLHRRQATAPTTTAPPVVSSPDPFASIVTAAAPAPPSATFANDLFGSIAGTAATNAVATPALSPFTAAFGATGTDPFAPALATVKAPATAAAPLTALAPISTAAAAAATTMSISDAFGDLVHVDDKPLPSLVIGAKTKETTEPPPLNPPTGPASNRLPNENNPHETKTAEETEMPGAATDDDSFGAFVDPSATGQEQKSPSGDVHALAPSILNDSTEFGDFCDSTQPPNAGAQDMSTSSALPVGVDSLSGSPKSIPAAERVTTMLPDPFATLSFTGTPTTTMTTATSMSFGQPPFHRQQAGSLLLSAPAASSTWSVELSDAAQEFLRAEPAAVSAGDWDALDALVVDNHSNDDKPPDATANPEGAAGESGSSPLFGSESAFASFDTSPPLNDNDDDGFCDFVTTDVSRSMTLPSAEIEAESGAKTPPVEVWAPAREGLKRSTITSAGADDTAAQDDTAAREDFGDFAGVGEIPSVTATSPETKPIVDDASDGFGDFATSDDGAAQMTAQAAVGTASAIHSERQESEARSVFREKGHSKSWDGIDTVNLFDPPPLERRSSAPTQGTALTAYAIGNFAAEKPMEAWSASEMQAPSDVPTSSSFDAFDEILGATQDAPLPLLTVTRLDEPPSAALTNESTDPAPQVERALLKNDDRQETEFYSASGSATDDSDAFESAAETDDEVTEPVGFDQASSMFQSSGLPREGPVGGVLDDPFAAFDDFSSPPPELPPLSAFDSQDSGTRPTLENDSTLAQDDLGFGGLASSQEKALGPPSTIPVEASESEIFGDFEAAELDAPENQGEAPVAQFEFTQIMPTNGPSEEGVDHAHDESFGDFASGFSDALHDVPERSVKDEDGFGNLNAIAAVHEPDNLPAVTPEVPGSTTLEREERVENPDNNGDEFGEFEALSVEPPVLSEPVADESIVRAHAPQDEDEFGDFAAFTTHAALPSSGTAAPGDSLEPSDASWDDFQGAVAESAAPTEVATPSAATAAQAHDEMEEKLKWLEIRKRLVDQSLRLPEAIRRRKDGSLVDFGRCFDQCVGLGVPVSEERRQRAQSCLLLLQNLNDNPSSYNLASTLWEEALSVALAELTAGVLLLEEAAAQLSESELAMCRSKLETFVHGLGEYVRISRSVVATVGDLLLVDTSSPFTPETLASTWCNLALMDVAKSIEKNWNGVEELAGRLSVKSKQAMAHRLEAVEEIRQASANGGREGHSWCEFTLQPLVPSQGPQGSSTKSFVDWDGREFMACTANFLQTKCPFYSIHS